MKKLLMLKPSAIMLHSAFVGMITILGNIAPASAADIKVLTAGAMKAVVLALAPEFEKQTGHQLIVDNDTAGGLAQRVGNGEQFDVAVITQSFIADLGG